MVSDEELERMNRDSMIDGALAHRIRTCAGLSIEQMARRVNLLPRTIAFIEACVVEIELPRVIVERFAAVGTDASRTEECEPSIGIAATAGIRKSHERLR